MLEGNRHEAPPLEILAVAGWYEGPKTALQGRALMTKCIYADQSDPTDPLTSSFSQRLTGRFATRPCRVLQDRKVAVVIFERPTPDIPVGIE
jgi:hypothetical protein